MATVRFGDVAERVNTKEDRLNTDLVYYVGGEHIESNALTVSGRGKIKEADLGPMFYFGFKPGDILFVTRNPHLRKCATVDFSGICSEKTLVIGTKDEDVLSQKYLATVMQSDDFWEFMEENKSGSVNYFINWSTLADYEFDLPPIERQRELANLLWAANDLKESYKKAIAATDEMLKAKFREMFGEVGDASRRAAESRSKWPVVSFDEVCELITDGEHATPRRVERSDIYLLSCRNIHDHRLELGDVDYIDEEEYNKIAKRLVPQIGDILISCSGSVGRCCQIREEMKCQLVRSVALLRFKSDVLSDFAEYAICGDDVQKQISMSATRTSQANLFQGRIKKLKLPLPPLSLQREFVAIAERADAAKSALKQSIADIDQVMKGLING